MQGLRATDHRLAVIAHRLVTANASLCTATAPATGMVLHALDQYRPELRADAKAAFGFARPVTVETVVPGSAADRAGVRQDDAIVSIAGSALPTELPAAVSSKTRDAAIARLSSARVPFVVQVERSGKRIDLRIDAPQGCRTNFEVLVGPGLTAHSDGTVVQIGAAFFDRYDDDMVAVVVAHELAHNVLRHRVRLDKAGVRRGLLAEIGRNGRLHRRTEDDADLLGVHLLRNAGYDPQIAVTFWRDHGGDVDGGLIRSRTHAASSARAKAIAAEIAHIPPGAPTPFVPPVLATRDQPLR